MRLLAGEYGVEGHIDGPVREGARMIEPRGIAVDTIRGRVYIAELHAVRCLDLRTGTLTTLAGCAEEGFEDDVDARAARFNNLRGIALSPDATELIVCDFWNHSVRQIWLGGDSVRHHRLATASVSRGEWVRSIAGGISSVAGSLCTPNGVSFDRNGDLLVACGSGFDDDAIRRLSRSKHMAEGEDCAASIGSSTGCRHQALVAGIPGTAGADDGAFLAATFDSPQSVAIDSDNGSDMYVADYCNHTIRKLIAATGQVLTVGGRAGQQGWVDGLGSISRFEEPLAIALSPSGDCRARTVFVSEGSGRIRWLRRTQWCTRAQTSIGRGTGTAAATAAAVSSPCHQQHEDHETAADYLVGTIEGVPELWNPV